MLVTCVLGTSFTYSAIDAMVVVSHESSTCLQQCGKNLDYSCASDIKSSEKILLPISHASGTDEAQILNSLAIERLFSCIWMLWYISLVVMKDDGVQMQTLNSFIVLFNHQLSLLQNSISDTLWEILPM